MAADPILMLLVHGAEAEEPAECDITLLVGGFLVSGSIISFKKYAENQPLMKVLNEAINEVKSKPPKKSKNILPQHIHLRDAKYFLPDVNPIPGNQNVYVRIDLDSVCGFSLGKLFTEKL